MALVVPDRVVDAVQAVVARVVVVVLVECAKRLVLGAPVDAVDVRDPVVHPAAPIVMEDALEIANPHVVVVVIVVRDAIRVAVVVVRGAPAIVQAVVEHAMEYALNLVERVAAQENAVDVRQDVGHHAPMDALDALDVVAVVEHVHHLVVDAEVFVLDQRAQLPVRVALVVRVVVHRVLSHAAPIVMEDAVDANQHAVPYAMDAVQRVERLVVENVRVALVVVDALQDVLLHAPVVAPLVVDAKDALRVVVDALVRTTRTRVHRKTVPHLV